MATITVSGTGSPLSFAAGATVSVSASPATGSVYLWEFLDVPAGSAAAFAAPAAQNTTFTADIEGTYLFRVTIDSIDIDDAVAAVPYLFPAPYGPIRVPAAGETFEANATKGWAPAVQAALHMSTIAMNLAISASKTTTWKYPAAKAASTGAVSLTGADPLIMDTITILVGDRVLLKDNAAGAENGIYDYAATGGTYTLTRSDDANSASKLVHALIPVSEGATHADKVFQQTVDTITLETTNLVWTLLASGIPAVAVPSGTATLFNTGANRFLRWVDGANYEVELTTGNAHLKTHDIDDIADHGIGSLSAATMPTVDPGGTFLVDGPTLGSVVNQVGGEGFGRNHVAGENQWLRRCDGVPCNLSPLRLDRSVSLVGISAASSNTATWDIEVYAGSIARAGGTPVDGTKLTELQVVASDGGSISGLAVNFISGSEVGVYVRSAGTVSYPTITLWFKGF